MLPSLRRLIDIHKLELKPLPREFYSCYTVNVAKKLLGKILVRETNEGLMAGFIVETEAYRGRDDPASHAYRGRTERNKVMWDKPGKAYVYQIYGIHYCLNIVTEPEGVPAAVLIRAIEPILGIDLMIKNRGIRDIRKLTNGPAKLAKAMNIDLRFNGWDMTLGRELYVAEGLEIDESFITNTPRIGVRDKRPWRFYIKGNLFVSRK